MGVFSLFFKCLRSLARLACVLSMCRDVHHSVRDDVRGATRKWADDGEGAVCVGGCLGSVYLRWVAGSWCLCWSVRFGLLLLWSLLLCILLSACLVGFVRGWWHVFVIGWVHVQPGVCGGVRRVAYSPRIGGWFTQPMGHVAGRGLCLVRCMDNHPGVVSAGCVP